MVAINESVFAATQRPDELWLERAVVEAPLEPDLCIVDAHMHFWHHHTGYEYFVKEFARDLATSGHKVQATVYVECQAMYRTEGPEHLKPVGETEFAVGMSAMAASGQYTTCKAALAIVGYADLTLGDRTREVLDAHVRAGNGRFRGVRKRARWDPDPRLRGPSDTPSALLAPAFGKGLDVLSGMGLSLDVGVLHPQIPEVTDLARAHADATIVLVHCGNPMGHSPYAGRQAQVRATWLRNMKELARLPNVSVKLGGLLMALGNFDFTVAARPPTTEELAALWRPYIEPCIELFGANRCMASSNFPVDKAGLTYGTFWNTLKCITAGCSSDERRMILGGTARRVYRMDRAPGQR